MALNLQLLSISRVHKQDVMLSWLNCTDVLTPSFIFNANEQVFSNIFTNRFSVTSVNGKCHSYSA